MLKLVILSLGEVSDCVLQRRYHSRHFDRAEASGEIPKSYALTRGDFSTMLEMTVEQTLRMTVTTNPPLGRGNKRGGK